MMDLTNCSTKNYTPLGREREREGGGLVLVTDLLFALWVDGVAVVAAAAAAVDNFFLPGVRGGGWRDGRNFLLGEVGGGG